MQDLRQQIDVYCEEHTSAPDEALYAIDRDIHLRMALPHMSAGPYMGQLLQFIAQMAAPKVAVELGSYAGYSTICLARGLAPDGVLHAVEAEEEFEPIILRHLQQAGVGERVVLHIGDAAEIISTLPNDIDLAFVDADKLSYAHYYEALLPKMRPGGWLLLDNMLWHDNIVQGRDDRTTAHLHQLNDRIQADPRVENLLLPVRDGVMVVKVKSFS